MKTQQITKGITYVGIDDRQTHLFENLWPLPYGVSYNSYIVHGSEKTALVDGTEASSLTDLVRHLSSILDDGKGPDYLVVNHMEPDHSGAIPMLMDKYPSLVIICNKACLDMLRGFYGISPERCHCVADKEEISLGDITLTFYMTPMVHWPETMMTYCSRCKVLFSGDAFGSFGALNGSVIDSDADTDVYYPEMYRYYSNIVAKYGRFVQNAFQKLQGLEIEYICPTHGPVWHAHIARTMEVYDRLSKWEPEDGTVIAYATMYGNTSRVAEYIAGKLMKKGEKVIMHRVSFENLSYVLSDIVRYKNVIIGTPTYSMELFPTIEALLKALKIREVKNKNIAAFTSYAWSPNVALKQIAGYAEDMGMPLVASAQMKQSRLEDIVPALDAMVEKITIG